MTFKVKGQQAGQRLRTWLSALQLNGFSTDSRAKIQDLIVPFIFVVLVSTLSGSELLSGSGPDVPYRTQKHNAPAVQPTVLTAVNDIPFFLADRAHKPRSLWSLSAISTDDPALINAPESTLPLLLTGAVSSNNPQRALAIIQYGGQQYSLRPGNKIGDSQAVIVRVFPDRVIIAAGNEYASLRLFQNKPSLSR